MLRKFKNRHPIDIADKTVGKLLSFIKPVAKRRKIDFKEYFNEIESETGLGNEPRIILSIDDLSSLGSKQNEIDMGGKVNGKIIESFNYMINNDIKITAYTIPKPCFQKCSENISSYIDRDFESLQNIFLEWSKNNIIEIAQHGYKHIRKDIRSIARSMEFEWKDSNSISKDIKAGYELLKGNDIRICGFKPSAWSIGQFDGKYELMKSIEKFDQFKYFSLSSPTNGLNYTSHKTSHIHPFIIKRGDRTIKNIPQNISILTPYKQNKELIKLICDKGGIVSIQSHAIVDSEIISDGIKIQECEKIIELCNYAKSIGAKMVFARDID
tara:strand:+ start:9393 stop:10370 length:978 start_codon:yes stop_codon:yes gene_type:complete